MSPRWNKLAEEHDNMTALQGHSYGLHDDPSANAEPGPFSGIETVHEEITRRIERRLESLRKDAGRVSKSAPLGIARVQDRPAQPLVNDMDTLANNLGDLFMTDFNIARGAGKSNQASAGDEEITGGKGKVREKKKGSKVLRSRAAEKYKRERMSVLKALPKDMRGKAMVRLDREVAAMRRGMTFEQYEKKAEDRRAKKKEKRERIRAEAKASAEEGGDTKALGTNLATSVGKEAGASEARGDLLARVTRAVAMRETYIRDHQGA